MNKHLALLFILCLTVSILVTVEPAYSVTKPSVPEFTVELDGDTVFLTIENQPLAASYDTSGYDKFYYNVRVKAHNSTNWTELYYHWGDYPTPSGSQYTILTYCVSEGVDKYVDILLWDCYEQYADVDFQIEAMVGNIVEGDVIWGLYVRYEFDVIASSGWSETQTLINHNRNPDLLYVRIGSPYNWTYNFDSVPLEVIITGETSWIGYSLDGQNNVTITGNTANLVGLSHGSHKIIVYATEKEGIIKKLDRRYFTVDLVTVPATVLALSTLAAIGVACAIYIRHFLKSRPKRKKIIQSELPFFCG